MNVSVRNTDWPADRVERRPVASLIPYARNARTHSDAQIGQIAASIREWGWTVPVLVDEKGGVIAGHGRLLAAQRLGIAEVPVMVASGWTAAQKRAYVIADNKLTLNGGWDDEALRLELTDLAAEAFDLPLLGFEEDELAALLANPTEGLTDPDDVPDVQAEAVTRPGDVWLLGKHRLMCGDSTVATDVDRLMAGNKADLCFTSPPYAQQRDYTEESKEKIADWDGLMQGVFSILPMAKSGQLLVNLGLIHRDGEWIPYWDNWIEWMRGQGWKRFGWYVWDQGFGLPGDWNGRFAPSHEFIFHFNSVPNRPKKWVDKKPENIKPRNRGESTMRGKDGATKAFTNPQASGQPTKVPDSIIRVGRQVGSDGHPAQFPVGLPAAIIESWPGLVYEPFSGSGTTIIAAEEIGRICYAMEISRQYVDVAVRRWQQFTGLTATLEGAGEPFPG